MIRAQFASRVQAEAAAPAVLWTKVNIDREAALELRRRVLNDLRMHEAHSAGLSRQSPQDAAELARAQALLSQARMELERLGTILARPSGA
jgi:hypothetical protein